MNKNNVVKAEERRQFFRVDEEVNLIYKKIDEQRIIDGSQTSENILGICGLPAALDSIAQEAVPLLYRLEKNHPDIAAYLKMIDTKIELLAQALVMQSGQFDKHNSRNANLSATGIAFDSAEAFQEGDYLEIKMLLANSMSVIIACGKVVYCKQNQVNNDRHPYVVAVDYVNIKDQDRELLIKHVVKRQLHQIRDKKESA